MTADVKDDDDDGIDHEVQAMFEKFDMFADEDLMILDGSEPEEPPINPLKLDLTTSNGFGSIQDDALLDELDLGGYDIHSAGMRGDPGNYSMAFFPAVLDVYNAQQIGVYDCILRFPHNRVNDEDVKQFCAAVRMFASRARAAVPRDKRNFIVCCMRYEILPDNKHVALSMARMSTKVYAAFEAARRTKAAKAKPTALKFVKGYI